MSFASLLYVGLTDLQGSLALTHTDFSFLHGSSFQVIVCFHMF